MDSDNSRIEVRRMDAGSWYWVSEKIIQEQVGETGFLAMCVYHFLASMVDETQSCYPSQQYIAKHLGCSRSAVNMAIKRLREAGLIAVHKVGKSCHSYLLLDARCQGEKTEVSTRVNRGVNGSDTNNNQLTRINNNTIVCVKENEHENGQRPETRKELFASEIAEKLDDRRNIRQYFSYTRRYPEIVLREFLSQALQTPLHRIKKSRAALFVYLVKIYDQQTS